ncbi:epidermal growth factor receptor kinase substrate 8-like protein 3 [Vombatus ursinus]|uniref:epidermal growth factor receptor kinase substrate 8-like protein 3 n=1 Tax=Vombatus ursinus TaxID=29139 RepID=UPI000FFD9972|nr:epidermal growth factor receptor kinase substrate 8-like protein 3 [Vombatus ursinus]
MDYVTHQDDWSHQQPRSALKRSNSISRPSGKTIYEQRKEYSQTMAAEPNNLKQRVEHLLTCKLGSGTIQEPKDVIKKLQKMDAQGQVWGQDVVLQVKNHWLQILDIETREEMDSYPLDGIQSLDAISNSCSYNSVLLINLQELGKPLTSVLLFQCWEVGAEILRSNLQKAIDESKERQESRYRVGGTQPNQNRWEAYPPENHPWNSTEQRLLTSYQPSTQEPQGFGQSPLQKAKPEPHLDVEREIVNISSLNLGPSDFGYTVEEGGRNEGRIRAPSSFMEDQRLEQWTPKNNNKKKKILGKKKTPKGLPSEPQYIEYFRKIKHAFNLLGKLDIYLQQPGAPEFVHILFQALTMVSHSNAVSCLALPVKESLFPTYLLLFPQVMPNCPNPHWAASVDVPRLTPKAIDLLNSCLTPDEMDFWKSLGEFWTTNTDHGVDQEPTNSTHTPRFYRQSESLEFPTVNHQHNPAKVRNNPGSWEGETSRTSSACPAELWAKGEEARGKSNLKDPMRLPGTEKIQWRTGCQRSHPPESTSPLPCPHLGGLRTLLGFIPYRASLVQKPLLMQVQYEFESRNPRELTVAQGEVLEILDQSRQWWLVKNEDGQRGYVPNNILEPLNSGLQRNRSWSGSPARGPMLRPTSKPQEVRNWLESENFSNITVKTLGILTGSQLLHMQPRELWLVCPEDAPRILERLEEVKMILGVRLA